MSTVRGVIPKKFPPKKNARDPSAEADELAPRVLAFLAADPDRLDRFFDLTGATPQSIRAMAATSGFAASLLDYLVSDERLLVGFAGEQGCDPAAIDALRQALTAPRDD